MKDKGHLPIIGIGPILCCLMAMLTAIGIFCSVKGIIPCLIENRIINTMVSEE